MILPIVAYGDSVLKKRAQDIDEDYPNLKQLIENMFETMYHANGIGLAAPQIGKSIRLFVIDATPVAEGEDGDLTCEDFKRVCIIPILLEDLGQRRSGDWLLYTTDAADEVTRGLVVGTGSFTNKKTANDWLESQRNLH